MCAFKILKRVVTPAVVVQKIAPRLPPHQKACRVICVCVWVRVCVRTHMLAALCNLWQVWTMPLTWSKTMQLRNTGNSRCRLWEIYHQPPTSTQNAVISVWVERRHTLILDSLEYMLRVKQWILQGCCCVSMKHATEIPQVRVQGGDRVQITLWEQCYVSGLAAFIVDLTFSKHVGICAFYSTHQVKS